MVEQGTKTEAWDIYPTNMNQLSKERYQRCRRFSKNRLQILSYACSGKRVSCAWHVVKRCRGKNGMVSWLGARRPREMH